MNLRTIVSLSCTNCPDVVQAMNQITLIHPDCNHTMVDGDLIPEELQQLGIQGVPTVLDGTAIVHVGKAGFGELLETLEARFGVHEAPRDGVLGEPQVFDQIVIGGGPAGISAAVYSARKGLRVALVAQRIGGQVNDTQGIENLISVPHTEGARLSADLRAHAKAYPISLLEHRRVISLQTRDLHRVKEVHLQGGEILEAPQVIIATGAAWRELGVPGEKEHIGKGVAFCPHCDGPFFKGKDVAVVGGGNSGIEAAIDLAGLARNVTVFEFADTLKADKVLVDKAQSLPNVSIHTSARTTEVVAKGGSVSGIRWEDRRDGALKEQALDGIFVQIGLVPQTALFSPLVESNKAGEIVVDSHGRTSVPGIYAAGDCATVPFKQIVVAMGSGATAALSAFEDRMRGV